MYLGRRIKNEEKLPTLFIFILPKISSLSEKSGWGNNAFYYLCRNLIGLSRGLSLVVDARLRDVLVEYSVTFHRKIKGSDMFSHHLAKTLLYQL